MKIVLDTNVWLSGTFWQGNPYKIIKLAERREVEIIITKQILEEIIHVLNKEVKFKKFIEDRRLAIGDLVRTILSISILTATKSKISAIKADTEDNKVLEAAAGGNADFIVSGDRHLLDFKQFNEIKIIKPKEFLDILER